MELRKIVAYRGPNVWAPVRVLEAWIDLGELRNVCTSQHPAFAARLLDWLPSLDAPLAVVQLRGPANTQTADVRDRFSQQLGQGTSLAVVLEHVVGVLEAVAGTAPAFTTTVADPSSTLYRVVFEYEEEELGRACLEMSRRLVMAAWSALPFDVAAETRRLVDLADDIRLGPSTRAITNAAAARGIPIRRLNTGSLVQLGEGRFQRRIWTAETDATSAIAEAIAQDKDLTNSLLRSVGVPVPRGRAVESAEDAWNAACEIGFPVTIKPRDANHGRGISLDLSTQREIMEAYDVALREGKRGVMVEQFARGQAHRLLVVGDRLIAAARGQREYVVGDGKQTIAQLVDEVNRDPLRGENYTDPLGVLKLEGEQLIELKKQGYTPESIPESGARVLVKMNGDLTTDVTSDVHPAVAEKAVLAAQMVGLDIAGLDVIAQEVNRPLEEQGGMIIEVNAGPGLTHHIAPLYGQPQPVGEAIVDMMFPHGTNGRIPIVAVTGTHGRAQVVVRIGRLLHHIWPLTATASSEGLFHRSHQIAPANPSDTSNVRALLLHPRVDAIVFESHLDQAQSEGLGCDRCDVTVVIDVPTEDAARAVRATVLAVPPTGTAVLPANAAGLAQLMSACRGDVVLFSSDGPLSSLEAHREHGGRVVVLSGDTLTLACGMDVERLRLPSSRIIDERHVARLLPSVAGAWAARVPIACLRDSLGADSD